MRLFSPPALPARPALIALLALGAGLAPPASAQAWKGLGGPEGGAVSDLLARGGILFAAGEGGVFRSADSGRTWSPANRGLPARDGYGMRVHSLADAGDRLLAAGRYGLFESRDGLAWTAVNGGLPDLLDLYADNVVAVGAAAVARVTPRGMFRRLPGQEGWTESTGGLDFRPPNDSWRPLLSAWGRVLVATRGGGVDLSDDTGRTWRGGGLPRTRVVPTVNFDRDGTPHPGREQEQPLEVMALAALPGAGGLLAGTKDGGVFRSEDTGSTWVPASGGLPLLDSVRHFPVTSLAWLGGIAYALVKDGPRLPWSGANAGFYRSADSGRTWVPAGGKPALRGREYYDDERLSTAAGRLAWLGPYGIWLSPDGAAWTPSNAGLANMRVLALAADGDDLFAGTDNGLYSSGDAGRTWTLEEPTDPVQSLLVHGGRVHAGTSRGVHSAAAGPVPAGSSRGWELTLPMPDGAPFLSLVQGKPHAWNARFLDFRGSLDAGSAYVTEDGEAWARRPEIPACAALAHHGGRLMAATSEGVWTAPDGDTVWYLGSLRKETFRLAASPKAAVALAWNPPLLRNETYLPTIYRTLDSGATWTDVNRGPFRGRWLYDLALQGERLVVGTDSGVWHSSNAGEGWAPLSEGLDAGLMGDRLVPVVAFAGGKLYAATRGGSRVFVLETASLGETPSAVREGPRRETALLRMEIHAGPHPRMAYSLPGPGWVRLTVHDLQGRERGVLAAGRRAAGWHREGLASEPAGLRVYRLVFRPDGGGERVLSVLQRPLALRPRE